MAPAQVHSLAKALRRSRTAVRQAVEDARDTFVERAGRYVDIHMTTVEAALANGDAKSLEVAARGAQWALEHVSADGVRVVEKTEANPGLKVAIGIKIGGVDTPVTAAATVVEDILAP